MLTRREMIAEMLENTEYPLTAQDLADRLDLKDRKVIFEDVEHIAKTVQTQGKILYIRPASCGKCGYEFRNRKVAKRPSKCPKCRSQWILLPGYIIKNVD